MSSSSLLLRICDDRCILIVFQGWMRKHSLARNTSELHFLKWLGLRDRNSHDSADRAGVTQVEVNYRSSKRRATIADSLEKFSNFTWPADVRLFWISLKILHGLHTPLAFLSARSVIIGTFVTDRPVGSVSVTGDFKASCLASTHSTYGRHAPRIHASKQHNARQQDSHR